VESSAEVKQGRTKRSLCSCWPDGSSAWSDRPGFGAQKGDNDVMSARLGGRISIPKPVRGSTRQVVNIYRERKL